MWLRPEPSSLAKIGLKVLDEKTLYRITRRGVTEIIVEEEFIQLLQGDRPLRLKMGFDPSRPDIHLGHVVGLRKLRQLQELGHQVILIVGDWTAQIGDPSGQSATRPMLTHQEVKDNAESYLRQFFRVVDREGTQVVWQSEWFGKFDLADVLRLTSRFTVAQFLDREDFAKRFEAHKPIAITELLYPLLQAYDSVAINSDVEFGGTDQKFNLLVGRELQEMMGQPPQQCFLMPILVGTDGVQKMSKSLDNYIAVEEHPNDMYGKVMSIPDSLLIDYYEYLTDVPDKELSQMRLDLKAESINPMELKKSLAYELSTQFHGAKDATAAQKHFEQVVQRGEAPEGMQEISFHRLVETIRQEEPNTTPLDSRSMAQLSPASVLFYMGTTRSKSEARRLIAQGAVEVNGEALSSDTTLLTIRAGTAIKVGKRRYVTIVDNDQQS